MAIVQISRITNRKGATENLPQLAGAELGWCIDSRRLFIGNGTLEEGAPVIGNTEILTQFSDIAVLSNYTYSDIVVGYSAQTGPTPSDPVVRSVQAKLDDLADVRDFGAVGDGVADDTDALQRAMNQLYCRETNTQIRRSLYFPAGTYRISSPLLIPTYAKLIGEGADCSIILLDTQDSSEPEYVAQYCDSQGNTGAQIGDNNATAPRNIEISSMTFQSNEVLADVFLVDQASECWFDSVQFIGALTTTDIENAGVTSLPEKSCIAFNSTAGFSPNNIVFDKCKFSNQRYGMQSAFVMSGITISNSVFDWLYQGVELNSNPTGIRLLHNTFDNVYAQGFVSTNTNLNLSAYNVYYNVGNAIGGGPTSPIIVFNNDTNLSINDLFERTNSESFSVPRVTVTTGSTSTGSTQNTMGRYTRNGGVTFTLLNNQTNQNITQVNAGYVKAFEMKYTIIRGDAVRHGSITVSTAPTNNSLPISYNDNYTETADTGMTLSVTQSGPTVSIKYTSTNTGISGTLTQSISQLA